MIKSPEGFNSLKSHLYQCKNLKFLICVFSIKDFEEQETTSEKESSNM